MTSTLGKNEEISTNPFFQSLKTIPELFKKLNASDNLVLCVPTRRSLGSANFNEHFIQTHVLRTSPYFKEEYINENGQCVNIKDGTIETRTGFQEARKVNILNEEIFYNEDIEMDGSYKVYLISGPLVGDISTPVVSQQQKVLMKSMEDRSLTEWTNAIVLLLSRGRPDISPKSLGKKLQYLTIERCREFNMSYTVLPGFIKAVGEKTWRIQNSILTEVSRTLQSGLLKSSTLEEAAVGIECLVLGRIYTKIYDAVSKQHELDDAHALQNFLKLSNSTAKEFGCGLGEHATIEDFDFSKAIRAMQDIEDKERTWPLKKLQALNQTANEIQKAIQKCCKKNSAPLTLAADDMLSCFAYCIVKAKLRQCHTVITYLTTFHKSRQITSRLDYLLVTFQGALAYLTKMHKPKLKSRASSTPPYLRTGKSYYSSQSQSVNFGVDTLLCGSPTSGDRTYKARSGKKRDFRSSMRKFAKPPKPSTHSFQQEEKTNKKTEEKEYKPYRSSSARSFQAGSKVRKPRRSSERSSSTRRYVNPTPQVIDPIDPGDVTPDTGNPTDLISKLEAMGPFGNMSGSLSFLK